MEALAYTGKGEKTKHAIATGRTVFRQSVRQAGEYAEHLRILKKGMNSKLGKKVTKGIWKGMPIFTLTLQERETCPSQCFHWSNCYGNNMHMAIRFSPDAIFERRLWKELEALNTKHAKTGFVVRLHVLGEFYSADYVRLWARAIKELPALHVYGYTHRHPGQSDGIGDAISDTRDTFDRFKIRFSDLPSDPLSANSEDFVPAGHGIVCPHQIKKTKECGTCGLCWTIDKPITFITH